MLLTACATPAVVSQEPVLPQVTETRSTLLDLPPPTRKLEVAVYEFEDVTGQFKPSDNFQNLSKAVSQGGASILVKALQDVGNRSWFTVVERTNLTNLLQERKIIRELRSRYLGEKEVNAKALPPMLFAGIILEGGIVGYDSNTLTGGAGARLLGIGAAAEYRQDTISVDLRAVSVKTGEVLASVVVQKSLISAGITASTFSYIDFDKILEAEAGITTNEPGLIALRKAIEKAVYALVMEGVGNNIWEFADKEAGNQLVRAYLIDEGRGVPDNVMPSSRNATGPAATPPRSQPVAEEATPPNTPTAAGSKTAEEGSPKRLPQDTQAVKVAMSATDTPKQNPATVTKP